MEAPMKPYSLDLRQRAVALYQECRNFSIVSARLQVSRAWIRKMLRLWQQTGSVEPQYQNCGRPPVIGEKEKEDRRRWLEEENGLTLKELQQRLAERGVVVSHTTVDNALAAMKITRKKNDRRRGKEPARRPRKT